MDRYHGAGHHADGNQHNNDEVERALFHGLEKLNSCTANEIDYADLDALEGVGHVGETQKLVKKERYCIDDDKRWKTDGKRGK